MTRHFISIIALLVSIASCATTRISHKGNNFASLSCNEQALIISDKGTLEVNNTSNELLVLLDSTALPHDYSYTVKLSQPNNKPGKTVKVKSGNGATVSIKKSMWGIALDITPCGDMIVVECECDNSSNHNDITSTRSLKLSVNKYTSTGYTTLATTTLNKGIDLYDKTNVLNATLVGNTITISMGRKKPQQVLKVNVERSNEHNCAGIVAGPGNKLSIERTMATFNRVNTVKINTQWNKDKLDKHFMQSTDPIEGYWTYLDRDLEDKWVRMGGTYTLALIANENQGYDIIYIEGAKTNKTSWHPFMLKGTLSKTMFGGVYQATWIDSTFEPLTEDIQATIENGVILTIKYPVLKSQLRFSKMLDTRR